VIAGWVGPAVFGAGIIGSLGFVLAGLVMLWRRALVLQKSVEAMQDLPLGATLAATSAKLARAQARIDELPALFLRVKVAFETLEASRHRLQDVATTAAGVLNLARLVFAPPKR